MSYEKDKGVIGFYIVLLVIALVVNGSLTDCRLDAIEAEIQEYHQIQQESDL